MPPKPKASTDSLKQKSLISFFGKGQTPAQNAKPAPFKTPFKTPSAKPNASRPAPTNVETLASVSTVQNASKANVPPSPVEPTTPDHPHASSSSVFEPSSVAYSRRASSPPTSDVIDIDMLDSDEDQSQVSVSKSITQSRPKRKVIVDDSDEDIGHSKSNVRKKEKPLDSSPTTAIRTNPKRQRLSRAVSDDDDEEDEEESTRLSFSQRVSRFKKSPVKASSRSRSRASSDDDDFIVPDDSEDEPRSTKSGKSSRRPSTSSRRSNASSDDEDAAMDLDDDDLDLDTAPKKGNAKAKAKSKSSNTKAAAKPIKATAGPAGSTFSMLTAAEQRERNKKEDKKSNEEPFAFLQDVRDKDGKRPGDPEYDPRTLYIPKSVWATFTPFEKQFWEIKQNHYDTILFFQKGKFFELYEDDARIGHQEFDLKLTNRVKMCMVGVPEMSFNLWASKFLAKGYKVGRVEQAETALGAEMRMAAEKTSGKGKAKAPAADKIVRRELNKVYTVGTLVEEAFLTDDQAGHCVSICEALSIAEDGTERDSERRFGICILDCSTSEFNLSSFEDDVCRTKLETLMRQIQPKELLFKKGSLSTNTQRLLKVILPQQCLWTPLRSVEGLEYDATIEELKRIYPEDDSAMDEDDDAGVSTLPNGVPAPIREFAAEKLPIEALGSMMWYLRQLNIDKDILSMKNFNIYDPMKRGMGLMLDGQTLAHLEVLLNNEGTEDGSLLKLLSRCVTPSGKRLFRIWLSMPLRELSAINARLDAVQDILEHPSFESSFTQVTKGLPDLERIVSRVHAKNCKVMVFLAVLKAFRRLSKGLTKLADEAENFESKTISGLLRGAPDLSPNIDNVESMFLPATEEKADELIPRPGRDAHHDEIIQEISTLEKELSDELKRYQNKLGMKLAYWHSAVGNKDIYLVEVANTVNKDKIPKDWVKSGGTKAKSRYIVTSLQKRIRQLKEAQENRNTAIKGFKARVFAEFDLDRSLWLRAIRVLAELDCLFSLAKSSSAIGEPSCRPEFVEGTETLIDFKELRHPTIAMHSRSGNFIPNDVKMGGDVGKIILLTGPNMAGKSTVMRMTATGVIMAQMGMMVPATSARLSAVDMIATRMGAYDNMLSNASTFKVELDECCKILRNATPKSLVILDELGRGTSTFDGLAIASAVLHELATHTLPLSFFATHYGSLTDDFDYHPNIRMMYMSTLVDDEKHELVFLYKLVNGIAESSFGTHVATLAGVPMSVVQRADVISKDFAEKFKARLQSKQKRGALAQLPLVAQADFVYLYKLGTGQIQLPEDPIRRSEVLHRMKSIVRRHLTRADLLNA